MVAGMPVDTLWPVHCLQLGCQGPALKVSPGATICEVAAIGERARVGHHAGNCLNPLHLGTADPRYGCQQTRRIRMYRRRNQERAITVEFKHEVLKAPELLEAVTPEVEALGLGEDYRWEVGGEIETQAETLPKLFKWLPHCGLLIVVLLIWQFNSFRRPLIILFTLPLAFVGAFVGLFGFRAPFDFFAILGLLSLAGIIINNGIVLIDKIDSERNTGRDAYTAVIEATVSRFRPICMTTITTILGVMPLIISHDPVFYSLALIIATGLAFGTVLTLGVVPVLYSVLFRVKQPETA